MTNTDVNDVCICVVWIAKREQRNKFVVLVHCEDGFVGSHKMYICMNIKRAVGRCFDGNSTALEKKLQLLHILCQISGFMSIKKENGARE
jgi:hypothetical protein